MPPQSGILATVDKIPLASRFDTIEKQVRASIGIRWLLLWSPEGRAPCDHQGGEYYVSHFHPRIQYKCALFSYSQFPSTKLRNPFL